MKSIHSQTLYELLEVEPSATQEEILTAYNRARATYGHNSPALYSLFNKEEAQELLKLIDEAYSILSNQFKRKQYDAEHTTGGGRSSRAESDAEARDLAIPSSDSIPEFSDQEFAEESRIPMEAPSTEPYELTPPPITQAKQPSTAQGGQTPFGSFQLDKQLEEEIKSTEVFSGQILQKVRLYKNVSLDQISELTKVSRPYLMAIESNNFSALPAPVFLRGFLVQISKILGLDTNKVTASYLQLLKEGKKK